MTRTITLDLDAYERLRSFRRRGESFSDVVRRAVFSNLSPTGEDLIAYYNAGGSGVPDSYLDAVEEAANTDGPPDNPYD